MTTAPPAPATFRCPHCPHVWHTKPCTNGALFDYRGRGSWRQCDCQTSQWQGGDDR